MSLPLHRDFRLFIFGLGFALLATSGCREPKATVYTIPKEKIATMPAQVSGASPHGVKPPGAAAADSQPMGTAPVATATGAELRWTAPASWQSKPATSMRKATFLVGDGTLTADIGITAFPGDVGGEVANVNRWRGQLGLPPIDPGAATAALVHLERNGLKIAWIELSGQANGAPSRLLGAMIPYGGATWFIKLLGTEGVVEKEKSAFLKFLETVQPASAQP